MRDLSGVQALRGFGALLVVAFHVTNVIRDRIDPAAWQFSNGMWGVDLFFTISGFVMVVSTKDLWFQPAIAGAFLVRRLLRVVPLYWIATTLKLLLMLLLPGLLITGGGGWWHTVASYFFIPAWNANHESFPLLVPAWTLAFEMFLYLWFALALRFRLHPVYWITPVFGCFAVMGILYAPFSYAPLMLFSPRLLEFCAGMWIALAVLNGYRLPVKLAHMVAPLALLALFFGNELVDGPVGNRAPLIWGVPAAFLLYAVASLEPVSGLWRQRWLAKLGDASYAIYLFHSFVVSAIGAIVAEFYLGAQVSLMIIMPLALVASALLGRAIYVYVEKPMSRYLRARFEAQRSARCQARIQSIS